MKKYSSLLYGFVIAMLASLLSCEETIIKEEKVGETYAIKGYAQKGPFIVGTNVTVAELNEKLFPTGRVFLATILDDKGRFEIPGVVLESPYVQIKIRGRYFSEITGNVLSEELTLYSLADIRKSEAINVNIITHVESERVTQLVQKENLSFDEAKAKAFKEFLTIFEWDNLDVASSELLDFTKNNQGGAILLAAASIFERVQDEYIKRLETITNFKADFADGKIDSTRILNRLLTAASLLNEEQIIKNLELKYGEIEFPNFGFLLEQFKQNSPYTDYTMFTNVFPESVGNKINLLSVPNNGNLNVNETYYILTNPPGPLPDAILEFSIEFFFPELFSLQPDPEVRFYPDGIFGHYRYYASNSKVWSQKSIPVNLIRNGDKGQGSYRCKLTIDGFVLVYKNNWFKY
jgi:hypothetical protein